MKTKTYQNTQARLNAMRRFIENNKDQLRQSRLSDPLKEYRQRKSTYNAKAAGIADAINAAFTELHLDFRLGRISQREYHHCLKKYKDFFAVVSPIFIPKKINSAVILREVQKHFP